MIAYFGNYFVFVSRKTRWRIEHIFISLEPEKFALYTGMKKKSNIDLNKSWPFDTHNTDRKQNITDQYRSMEDCIIFICT